MLENPDSNPFHADRDADDFLIDDLDDDSYFEPQVPTANPINSAYQSSSKPISKPALKPLMVLPQRFMLWAIACATVPTCIVAGFAYQIDRQSSRDAERRTQEIRAVALADSLNNFVLRQYENTKKFSQQLALSSDLANRSGSRSGKISKLRSKQPNRELSDRQKQPIINRLNQYKNSSKAIGSLAIYNLQGNLILQSANSASPPKNLDRGILQKVVKFNSPVLNQPVWGNNRYLIQFVVPIPNPRTQKIQAILLSQLPISDIPTNFATGNYEVTDLITDAKNELFLSAYNPQSTSLGGILAPTKVEPSDRSDRSMVVVSTPSLQGLPDLKWNVAVNLTEPTINYAFITVLGICILILIVAIALLTYFAARQLSYQLIQVSKAIDSIAEGKTEPQLSKLSVEGNDEIAQISANTNLMTQRFQALSDNQKQTIDQLQRLIAKGVGALHTVIHINGEDINSIDLEAIASHLQASLVKKQTEINLLYREQERIHTQATQALLIKEQELEQKGTEVKLLQAQMTDLSIQTVNQLEKLKAELESTSTQYKQILQEIVDESEQKQAQIDRKDGQIQALETQLAEVVANTEDMVQLQALTDRANRQNQVDKIKELANYSISSQNTDQMTKQIMHLREAIAIGAKKAKRLSESSQKISKIIDLIHEIGIEANFLTVNAGIKANREHNNDFSIFSDQVGKVANMSVSAMKEMEQLAENIQTETREVMDNLELGTTQIAEATKLIAGVKADLQNAEEEIKRKSIDDSNLDQQIGNSDRIENLDRYFGQFL